ncbi:MAG: transcriptional repressor [Chloroflexi bacterium]|nr:transcriptional repressor [Chloroflexota bacterium]
MSCEAEASAAIRNSGLRVTTPRMQVLAELMHAGSHVTARAMVQRVALNAPNTTPSTVYRTLSALRDARLVSETLMAGGETIYEAAVEGTHHHMECRSCGEVTDVPDGHFDDLRDRLLSDHGFEADLEHLAIKGLCAKCRSAKPAAKTSHAR